MKINHIIDEAVSAKFLNPQATAQDPGLEREKDVDVIIFGRMPQDFTFLEVVQALEAVLPREYPPQPPSERGMPSSPAELKGSEIAENNGAVVTTKPLSIAQKVVKEFQARGIKCTIRNSGLEEGTAGLPDPNNFDSDWDYQNALDAYGKPPADAPEPDEDAWMGETKEKVGNMDADAFDAALSRMKKLAGAGPLKTVYDPNKRVYKNVPHAVQPAQQPKKAR